VQHVAPQARAAGQHALSMHESPAAQQVPPQSAVAQPPLVVLPPPPVVLPEPVVVLPPPLVVSPALDPPVGLPVPALPLPPVRPVVPPPEVPHAASANPSSSRVLIERDRSSLLPLLFQPLGGQSPQHMLPLPSVFAQTLLQQATAAFPH
jgi:hypothetical protein